MIVKIILHSDKAKGRPQISIYNENKTLEYKGPATREIMGFMFDGFEKFAVAEIKDKAFFIVRELPPQGW